ncbi:Uncharacterized protein TCM_014072 [Theobroma cacao]|uniref:Uncharacterized protein n=1 Tax=Theobroma cacao TaxID=3641 RepID=A0A061G4D8_THECC|nr:Uncharacterized protein TCM_014072 [Theobroma cacao]
MPTIAPEAHSSSSQNAPFSALLQLPCCAPKRHRLEGLAKFVYESQNDIVLNLPNPNYKFFFFSPLPIFSLLPLSLAA